MTGDAAMAGGGVQEADLGPLAGPLLVFGGPVSNLQATHAVLAQAARLGISAGRIICTGDVVAYGGDPQATVAAVREAGIHVVMGNCEESLGRQAADCGCNFGAGSACDRLAAAWYGFAQARLSPGARAWMRGLPRRLRFVLGGRRFCVVHGAPFRISRWVFPSTPAATKRRELARAGAEAVIAGHSGLPFAERIGDGLWVNPGSVGLPANDGTPRTWYAVLWSGPTGLEVRIEALHYDYDDAAARIRRAGLPPDYARTLATGIWPSFDVLPQAERAAAGVPLPAPQRLHWPAAADPRPAAGQGRASRPSPATICGK